MTPKHYSPTPDLAGGSAPVDSQGDKEYILDSMTKRVWLKSECDESMLIGFPNRYVQVFLSDAALQGTGGGMTGFDSKRFYEYMRKNDFAWSKDVESEQEWCDAVDLYFTLLKDESPNDQAPAQGQAVDAGEAAKRQIDILVSFQIYLQDKKLINGYDWAFDKEAEKFLNRK